MKNYVGIDVAKISLAVAFPLPIGGWTNTTFANTPDGIRSLIKQLPAQAHCILEATGSYSVLVTYMLCQSRIEVSVINPKQSHNFAPQEKWEITMACDSTAAAAAILENMSN